jgi:hypothetical protein
MKMLTTRLPASLIAVLLLFFTLSSAPSAGAQQFEVPWGFTAQISGGLSAGLDVDNMSYDPGFRVGVTAGYELDLPLPFRSSLRAQVSVTWSRWGFANTWNHGVHDLVAALGGVTYTVYDPLRLRNVSVWGALEVGFAESTVLYEGFILAGPPEQSYGGFTFRGQVGAAYHLRPDLSLGLALDITETGMDEVADLNFASTSLDIGLVLRGRFAL